MPRQGEDAPLILAVDTASPQLAVGARRGDRFLVRSRLIRTGHAEHLAPMVRAVLDQFGAAAREIDRLLVTVGPGSFTGVRVGVSFAAGIAAASRAIACSVSSLEALQLSAPEGRSGAIAIDARRGEVYLQRFGPNGPDEVSVTRYEDAGPALAQADWTAGDGVVRATSAEPTGPRFCDLRAVLAHADRFPPGPLSPVYLRAPDAVPMAHT